MKRIISVIVAFMLMLCVSGCAKGTKLTKENCEDYLEISVENHTNVYAKNYHGTFYDGAYGKVTVNGASNNYDYKDVEIVVLVHYTEIWTPEANFWNYYEKMDTKKKEVTVEVPVKLNIAGNGSQSFTAEFFTCWDKTYAGGWPAGYSENDYCDWPSEVEAYYEITSVEGTVSK